MFSFKSDKKKKKKKKEANKTLNSLCNNIFLHHKFLCNKPNFGFYLIICLYNICLLRTLHLTWIVLYIKYYICFLKKKKKKDHMLSTLHVYINFAFLKSNLSFVAVLSILSIGLICLTSNQESWLEWWDELLNTNPG